jgi:hypothetical protein
LTVESEGTEVNQFGRFRWDSQAGTPEGQQRRGSFGIIAESGKSLNGIRLATLRKNSCRTQEPQIDHCAHLSQSVPHWGTQHPGVTAKKSALSKWHACKKRAVTLAVASPGSNKKRRTI